MIVKIKAIVFPVIGVAHIVFWKYLPNPVLAAVIAVSCLGLGVVNISKWQESKGRRLPKRNW